ncbi:MAG: Crp/Fnr family transcriptional regulator [Bradymonadaceae bacterium]
MQDANRSDKLELVSRCEPFTDLSERSLWQLSDHAELDRRDGGEVLWEEGDPPCCISLITAGTLKRVGTRDDGREFILDLRHSGEFVGYDALGSADGRRTRTEALSEARLLRFREAPPFSVLEPHPSVLEAFVDELERSRSALIDRLQQLCTAGAERRLAMVFARLAEHRGHPRTFDDGARGIWRSDLAGLINTRIETAIRLMSDWRNADLIRTDPDGFALYDPNAIRALARGEDSDTERPP